MVTRLVNQTAQRLTDAVFACLPRCSPAPAQLAATRIVAHRGGHDGNLAVLENTLPAFDRCVAAGVWGIEFDLQWTKDARPVVIHDTDGGRVFARPAVDVKDLTQAQLKRCCPEIPAFEEVLQRYAGKLHLMIEVKTETFRPGYAAVLENLLRELGPGEQFHLLCLDIDVYRSLTRFPPSCYLPVALWNTKQVFERVIDAEYGGMAGHYALLNRPMRRRLRERRREFGTGHIASRSTLLREIGLGASWIFSDRALALQNRLDELRSAAAEAASESV